MTRNEQIEEMAESVVCSAIVSKAKIDDKVAINLNKFVENMIRIGYRKIDDDCAVITKAELKQYKVQAVKEFAEKLKKKLFEFFQDNEGLDGKISVATLYVDIIGIEATDGAIISLGLIDRLLKE